MMIANQISSCQLARFIAAYAQYSHLRQLHASETLAKDLVSAYRDIDSVIACNPIVHPLLESLSRISTILMVDEASDLHISLSETYRMLLFVCADAITHAIQISAELSVFSER